MPKPSKRRPWAVELKPPHQDGWYHLDSYRDKAEADMQARLAKRRTKGEAEVRVVKNEGNANV